MHFASFLILSLLKVYLFTSRRYTRPCQQASLFLENRPSGLCCLPYFPLQDCCFQPGLSHATLRLPPVSVQLTRLHFHTVSSDVCLPALDSLPCTGTLGTVLTGVLFSLALQLLNLISKNTELDEIITESHPF